MQGTRARVLPPTVYSSEATQPSRAPRGPERAGRGPPLSSRVDKGWAAGVNWAGPDAGDSMSETRGPLRPDRGRTRRGPILAAALLLAVPGAGCWLEPFPPLVESTPAHGAADVARSAWIGLPFPAAVPRGPKDSRVLPS